MRNQTTDLILETSDTFSDTDVCTTALLLAHSKPNMKVMQRSNNFLLFKKGNIEWPEHKELFRYSLYYRGDFQHLIFIVFFCSIFTQLWKDVFRHQIVRRSTAKGVTLLPLKKAIKLTLDLYRRRIWTMQMASEYLYIFIFVSPILLQSENLVIVFLKPDPAKAKLPLLPVLKIQRKSFA